MTFKHPEAFCLMRYVVEATGESEVLWNSRDGVTPFVITSRNGDDAIRIDGWRSGVRAPGHVPAVGDRIFVDLTEARARALVADAIAERRSTPEGLARLEALYASPEEAFEVLLRQALNDLPHGKPDILVVTAGYLESLKQARAALGFEMPVRCPACGDERSHTSNMTGQRAPRPNDITVCINCGEILLFASDMSLRHTTVDERSRFSPIVFRTATIIIARGRLRRS